LASDLYLLQVEGLMNEFTTDVGISWEQLYHACTKSGNLSRQHRVNGRHKKVARYLCAANCIQNSLYRKLLLWMLNKEEKVWLIANLFEHLAIF